MIRLKITEREFEILLAEKGYTQSEIARKLFISRNTVTLLKKRSRGSIGEVKARKLCDLLEKDFDVVFERKKV